MWEWSEGEPWACSGGGPKGWSGEEWTDVPWSWTCQDMESVLAVGMEHICLQREAWCPDHH